MVFKAKSRIAGLELIPIYRGFAPTSCATPLEDKRKKWHL